MSWRYCEFLGRFQTAGDDEWSEAGGNLGASNAGMI